MTVYLCNCCGREFVHAEEIREHLLFNHEVLERFITELENGRQGMVE